MKIALCLSGHARTYDLTYPMWYNNLIRFGNVDVFMHLWDTIGPRELPNPRADFDSGIVKSDMIDSTHIMSLWNPVSIVVENYDALHPMFQRLTAPIIQERDRRNIPSGFEHHHPLSVRSMLYKRFKCNQLKTVYEEYNNFKYDLVIQARPDIALITPIQIKSPSSTLHFHNSRSITPDPEICDFGAIGKSHEIDVWCSLYQEIDTIFNLISQEDNFFRFLNPHKMYVEYLRMQNQSYEESDLGLCIIRSQQEILGWDYAKQIAREMLTS